MFSSRDGYQRWGDWCWGHFFPRPPLKHLAQYLSEAIPLRSFFSHIICWYLPHPYSEWSCTSQNQKGEKYMKHGLLDLADLVRGIELIYYPPKHWNTLWLPCDNCFRRAGIGRMVSLCSRSQMSSRGWSLEWCLRFSLLLGETRHISPWAQIHTQPLSYKEERSVDSSASPAPQPPRLLPRALFRPQPSPA